MRISLLTLLATLSIGLLGACDQGTDVERDDERGAAAAGKADQILGPCDDGSLPVCTIAEPECGPDEILAAINGCVACVDPKTCEPTDPDYEAPSCEGACGGESPDGCYCDDLCEAYGDCCEDHADVCVDEGEGCDDGSQAVCLIAEPDCPEGTIVAVHNGCFTCADEDTCEPKGLPLNCDDGTHPVCLIAEPTCAPDEVLAVQNGCFACVDPFTCE